MSLSTTLDVVIGLVFTYLLLGIIASGIQEVWVALINQRGKELENGIASLLSGSGLFKLDDKVFSHSLVFGLSPGDRKPSYVPARNFALAVVEALRDGGQGPVFSEIERTVAALPAGTVKESFTAFVTDAKGDLDALKKSIETWFDDSMDRVTGIYKRYTQIFTFIFGLAAAIVFNVDSITLARTLWTNGPLRDATLAAAQQWTNDHSTVPTSASAPSPAADKTLPQQSSQPLPGTAQPSSSDAQNATAQKSRADAQARVQKNIEGAVAVLDKLPIGWVATQDEKDPTKHPNCAKNASTTPQTTTTATAASECSPDAVTLLYWRLAAWPSNLWMILGWLITALATSLGAPFWFDALKNLMQLRNTGPKPSRSDQPATATS
jgi:hypothetical protein